MGSFKTRQKQMQFYQKREETVCVLHIPLPQLPSAYNLNCFAWPLAPHLPPPLLFSYRYPLFQLYWLLWNFSNSLVMLFPCLCTCNSFSQASVFFFWSVTLSVQFSHSVVSESLRPHGLQHTRPPCPSLSPVTCSNSCPLSW